MAMSPYRVFRRPHLTEKSTILQDKYTERAGSRDFVKYTLEVDPKASKTEIRAAVEALFPDTVGNIVKVNTIRVHGRSKDGERGRRSRKFRPGRTPARKKAVVTLRGGVTISQFEGA